MNEWIFTLLAGLVFGSFVTLASYRLPRGQDIVVKSSRCPSCDKTLGFKDLWPVLSWLVSRARCRYCGAAISPRYPVIELIACALFAFAYAKFGLTAPGIIFALFAAVLLIMIIVDLEHYLIPDPIHYALMPLAIAWHYVLGTPPEEVVDGFLLGAGIGLGLHYGYRAIRKREGLGFGDVKFFAVSGLWLGMYPLVPFLFFAGVLGTLTGLLWKLLKRGTIFPFGPALAMSLFIGVAFPELSNLFWNMGKLLHNQ